MLTSPDPADPENRFLFKKDTGIMLCGDDCDFVRRSMIDQLRKSEPIVEIIDSTQEGHVHRASSLAGLPTFRAALGLPPIATPEW